MGINFTPKDQIDKIKNHKVSLDKEKLWADLVLAQKKEKNRIYLWLLPMFLLLLMIGFWLFNQGGLNQRKTSFNKSDKKENVKDILIERNSTSNDIKRSIEPIKDLDTNVKNSSLSENKNHQSHKDFITTKAEKSNAQKITTNRKLSSKSNYQATKTIGLQNSKQSNKVNADGIISKRENGPFFENSKELKTIKNGNNSKNQNISERLNSTERLNKRSIVDDETINTTIPFLSTNTLLLKWVVVPIAMKLNFVEKLLPPQKDEDLMVKKPANRSFEIYTGYGLVSNNLETKDSIVPGYYALRNESETILDDWFAGIKYNHRITNGFTFSTGVEWSQITSRLRYSETIITSRDTMIEDEVKKVFINAIGDSSVTEIGAQKGYSFAKTDYHFYNQYYSLNIPLTVGYEIQKERWAFGGELGMHINALFLFKGHLINERKSLQENPTFFKTNIGLSWAAQLNVAYRLNQKVSLTLSPSLKIANSSIAKDEHSLSQKLNGYRMHVGLKYNL